MTRIARCTPSCHGSGSAGVGPLHHETSAWHRRLRASSAHGRPRPSRTCDPSRRSATESSPRPAPAKRSPRQRRRCRVQDRRNPDAGCLTISRRPPIPRTPAVAGRTGSRSSDSALAKASSPYNSSYIGNARTIGFPCPGPDMSSGCSRSRHPKIPVAPAICRKRSVRARTLARTSRILPQDKSGIHPIRPVLGAMPDLRPRKALR